MSKLFIFEEYGYFGYTELAHDYKIYTEHDLEVKKAECVKLASKSAKHPLTWDDISDRYHIRELGCSFDPESLWILESYDLGASIDAGCDVWVPLGVFSEYSKSVKMKELGMTRDITDKYAFRKMPVHL